MLNRCELVNFLFDIDGTLTEPRGKMNEDFRRRFGTWVTLQRESGNSVYFVTGSDKDKTVEQIGTALWRHVNGSYQNCGNQLYKRGRLIKESNWQMTAHLHLDLLILAERSPWYNKADKKIEERIGMVNFSTLGRDASVKLRKSYFEWDKAAGERKSNAEWLSLRYPKLDFSIGGEISTDIYPKGKDKSQVLDDLCGRSIFFGDSCNEGGNDHTIAHSCDHFHQVLNWKDCDYIMRSYYG